MTKTPTESVTPQHRQRSRSKSVAHYSHPSSFPNGCQIGMLIIISSLSIEEEVVTEEEAEEAEVAEL